MPELCRFLGVVIAMYIKDHLPPHFHAYYGKDRRGRGGEEALININTLEVFQGCLPRPQMAYVITWASLYQGA